MSAFPVVGEVWPSRGGGLSATVVGVALADGWIYFHLGLEGVVEGNTARVEQYSLGAFTKCYLLPDAWR